MSDLLLDERIISWVFFPIIYITILLSVLRYYVTEYLGESNKKKSVKTKTQYS